MREVKCEHCGTALNPDGSGVMRKVSCWAVNGKTGRPQQIREPVDLGFYMHKFCYDAYKRGTLNQTSLF